MGRGKIEIKKIENANSRQVTFSKRRGGLFKKANELAILCDADVAVIVYSNTGKLFEFSSSSMKKILSRYTKCIGSVNAPSKAIKSENEDSAEVDALKEEIEKLKSKHMQLLGKDLAGLSLTELHELEQQLNEGFICIKEKKEQLLMQEIAESRMLEQRAVQENETLRRQIEELKDFVPSTNQPEPIDYGSMENNSIVLKRASESPGTECNGDLADEASNTTLTLGPSTMVFRKRKTPDGETHSSNSETQVKFSL